MFFPFHKNQNFSKFYTMLLIVSQGLWAWRFQLCLTLITMAIGSLALSATFFIGDGALKGLWKDLDRLMGNRIYIYADGGPNDILLKQRPYIEFTNNDFENLKKNIYNIKSISPILYKRTTVENINKSIIMHIDGITSELENEEMFTAIKGQGFSEAGRKGYILECLLTKTAAKILNVNLAKKKYVRIQNDLFLVKGIIPNPPETSTRFQKRIIIPYNSGLYLWGKPDSIKCILILLNDSKHMENVIDDITQTLDKYRAPGAYRLSSSQFRINKRKNIVFNIMAFGSAQAFFCILIAAIGTINVMLANVTRRTREFAIRIAMGAKHSDIAIIVLAESLLIGFLGSILGIVISLIISSPLCNLLAAKVPETSKLQPYYSLSGILITIAVCSLSSLFAGIIPAIRTQRLDILSVLRSE